MELQRVSIPSGEASVPAYFAPPEGEPKGGIIVLHEIFGANEAMQAEAAFWAKAGYAVVLPDLYHLQAPGSVFGYCDEERNQAIALWQDFDVPAALADIEAVRKWLSSKAGPESAIGAIGFCLGGQLAVLSGPSLDAAIAFYPVKMAEHEDDLKALETPLLVHCGTDDLHIAPEVLDLITRSLAGHGPSEHLLYEAAQHGFYNHFRPSTYSESDAKAARDASRSFFETHLG